MVASPTQSTFGADFLSNSQPITRRLSPVIFGFFQSALHSRRNGQAAQVDAESPRTAMEIADYPAAQHLVDAMILRRKLSLPPDLTIVPERVSRTGCLHAAGFSDSRSGSVGVDVAIWSEPCSDVLDEVAWRRVYTWVVGSDQRLANLAIIDPPEWSGPVLTGSYSYVADGIAGYGVLRVAADSDGSWLICDCRGDAPESSRVDELARCVGAACAAQTLP